MHGLTWCSFSGKDESPGLDLLLFLCRSLLDGEVSVDDREDIEGLSLVLPV